MVQVSQLVLNIHKILQLSNVINCDSAEENKSENKNTPQTGLPNKMNEHTVQYVCLYFALTFT